VRATVEALTARLQSVTAAEVADRLGGRLVASNRPAPVAPLAQASALDALTPDSVLVARAHQRHVVSHDGDSLVLRLSDRTLRLPQVTSKAVRALLDGEQLRVADLPDLDDDDAMSLARRLVREAVVVLDDGS